MFTRARERVIETSGRINDNGTIVSRRILTEIRRKERIVSLQELTLVLSCDAILVNLPAKSGRT